MIMATCFNGAERSTSDWKRLLHEADPRFKIRDIVKISGKMMSVMEVVWTEESLSVCKQVDHCTATLNNGTLNGVDDINGVGAINGLGRSDGDLIAEGVHL